MSVIVALETHDVRFPTSCGQGGPDAMNPDPDYSAASDYRFPDGCAWNETAAGENQS